MKPLRQAFSYWCFSNRGVEHDELLAGAARLGYEGVDLIDETLWPAARRHGLAITAIGGHDSIEDGLNRSENVARIQGELRDNIAKAHQWKIPVLICFSGNRYCGADDKEGLDQCAETLAHIAPEAAEAGWSWRWNCSTARSIIAVINAITQPRASSCAAESIPPS